MVLPLLVFLQVLTAYLLEVNEDRVTEGTVVQTQDFCTSNNGFF